MARGQLNGAPVQSHTVRMPCRVSRACHRRARKAAPLKKSVRTSVDVPHIYCSDDALSIYRTQRLFSCRHMRSSTPASCDPSLGVVDKNLGDTIYVSVLRRNYLRDVFFYCFVALLVPPSFSAVLAVFFMARKVQTRRSPTF